VFVTQLEKLGIADTKNNVKIKTPILNKKTSKLLIFSIETPNINFFFILNVGDYLI